jgi:ATP-dependent RNA helicase DDX19/DBP5
MASTSSLAGRITKDDAPAPAPVEKQSWADETEEDAKKDSKPPNLDGASSAQAGSALSEPDYAVQVKLSELQAQADPNNPLYSAKSFEELGLYVEKRKCTGCNYIC